MNALIVHAHPETQSFNASLTATAVHALAKQGHAGQVSDLYAIGWS